jgi:hypothetical protein
MLPAKFGSIWPSCFRGEDFLNISQSEKRINLGIVSDSPTLHSRWLLFFKVMIISL